MCYPRKCRQRKSASTTAPISQKSNDFRKKSNDLALLASGRPIIVAVLPNHENGAKIIDVGPRRPRDDEVADRRIEAIAVIVGELRFRTDSGGGGEIGRAHV